MFATLQAEGNVIVQPSSSSEIIYSVYLPVPDINLSLRQAYGNLFRPRQSWFNDPLSARQKFVQMANNLMNQINWIDVNPTWDENISIQAQLFETPNYTVATLADMFALLTTPNFNDGSTIYVTSDITHGGNWSFWQYNASSTAKFILLQVQTYNTNLFWSRVDWFASGYNSDIINGQNVLVFSTLADRNTHPNFEIGQLVKVSDNGDGRFAAYVFNGLIGNTANWTMVAHQQATVNFSSNLYDFSTVSASNLSFVEHAASEAMIHIIDGFFKDLSTIQNKNVVTVGMIREAYRQNITVDWAFKSSYISAVGLEEPLLQNFLFQPDPSDNIFDYLNTTKPFHSKFRGLIEKKTTSDDLGNTHVVDTLQETITLRLDAVSVQPDQTLLDGILSLPETTSAEKQFKKQQIKEKFTAAERIAVFTNYDPVDVLPGAKYRGLDIDGVNFNDFSTLFGINLGYDNSPYDNILGYDFDQTSQLNLYDVFINGKTFTDPDPTNGSDIIIDGDKFQQPYLAEGHPDQLAQMQVGDVLEFNVYTQDQPSAFGYDVLGYDTEGYDQPPVASSIHVAFRLFKNITDQWQYQRISDANSTVLTQVLRPYDTEVIVNDATVLSQPNLADRIPGIVFISEERILFWQVDTSGGTGNHKLKQILRGTAGTAWGNTHYTLAPVHPTVSSSVFYLPDNGLKNGQDVSFTGTPPAPLTSPHAFLDDGSITYTAVASGTPGNAITIAYTSGGTAGLEVVTVTGNNISVQIQSGVSTGSQIKTAVNSSGPAAALVTVTGTDSTTRTTMFTTHLRNGGTNYFVVIVDKDNFMLSSTYLNSVASPPVTITITGSGTTDMVVPPGIVRDAGVNQSFPMTQWNWYVTPNGLALDNSQLGNFLRAGQGTYDFT